MSLSKQPIKMMFQCKVCNKFCRTEQGLRSHITRLKHHESGFSQTIPKSMGGSNEDSSDENDSNQSETRDPTVSSVTDSDMEGFLLELSTRKTRTKILRRIPKGSRSAAADSLATAIDMCVSENSITSWKRLARFAAICFAVPSSSHMESNTPKVSLATQINRNIRKYEVGDIHTEPTAASTSNFSDKKSLAVPAGVIESKIADGDVKGAVRILCSEMTLAPFDISTLNILKEKHPQQESFSISQDLTSHLEVDLQDPPIPINVDSIRAAIASFPPGSAAGPDMIKPQHLKDLTSRSAGASGSRLLISLVKLCSLMLRGKVPEQFCPIIYGASLCALNKKNGGIRPIAVGNTFRRLVAKIGCQFARPKLEDYFKPTQFGFGVRGGSEAVAHAARRFISYPHSDPKIFLKLDFKNAFNSVHRQVFLEEASTQIPELLPFLHQCYGKSSHLTFGQHVITSSCGIQQGDPLGPVLFCLAVHPLAKSLSTELNLWYLDDSSIGGSAQSVLQNLRLVTEKSSEIGLELNLSKCELFFINFPVSLQASVRESFTVEAPGIRFPKLEDLVLLGAPLNEVALIKAMENKTADLERLSDNLVKLSSHYAFYVLKNCLAIPKLIYILRCAPVWRVPNVAEGFDLTLLTTLEKVINISLPTEAKSQSSLPISDGGLGLKQVSLVALPAFLASVFGTSDLLPFMLPPDISNTSDSIMDEACDRWITLSGQQLPSADLRGMQKHWEKGLTELVKEDVLLRATTLLDKARLLSVSSKASGAFLNAVPSPSLGTFLPNPVFRIAVSLRLGTEICQPHMCPCGVEVDRTALHGLSCKSNPGRATRHAMVNDVVRRGLVSAGYPVVMEPSFISPETNKRPDGITLAPWEMGKSLAWDFTCVNSQATSYLSCTAGIPLHAASKAEMEKRKKYSFLEPKYIFAPIAAECLGAFGESSRKILEAIGRKIEEATGERRSREFFFQRLSIAIQRGNATAILGSIPRGVSLDEDVCML